MDAQLETIIDQAQKLPAAQRLQLIAALSERMARGAGIEEADRELWRAKTLDDHAAEQGILEPQSLARFHASDAWPEDDDLEELLRDLEARPQRESQVLIDAVLTDRVLRGYFESRLSGEAPAGA